MGASTFWCVFVLLVLMLFGCVSECIRMYVSVFEYEGASICIWVAEVGRHFSEGRVYFLDGRVYFFLRGASTFWMGASTFCLGASIVLVGFAYFLGSPFDWTAFSARAFQLVFCLLARQWLILARRE